MWDHREKIIICLCRMDVLISAALSVNESGCQRVNPIIIRTAERHLEVSPLNPTHFRVAIVLVVVLMGEG